MSIAWECRDQADQAEIYYNHPLRAKVRRLEDENLNLKRLLRENGISWQIRPKLSQKSVTRVTRSSSKAQSASLPHLPVEVQLRILSYALTSPHAIVDPLCKLKQEHMSTREKSRTHFLAIHFLATCRAYYIEGTKLLWTNNSFIFTSPEALRNFAEIDLNFRREIKEVNFRVIARFYDDEDRTHRIDRRHHPDIRKPITLTVHRRPKENTLARRGFRTYGWYQLVDFLAALLPPFDPSSITPCVASTIPSPTPPPKLLPSLEKLRIDFVNFGEDLFNHPPPQLHELASHQFGCTLNELVLTGLPNDETGLRVSSELSGLLKDEGLLIDHAPTMVSLKNFLRPLNCDTVGCHYSAKVVRGMRTVSEQQYHDDVHAHFFGVDFPPAPEDEGEPPYSPFHSCRTIWKKVPVRLDDGDERKWELFDRISGSPWTEVAEDVTLFDHVRDNDFMVCDNCGETHPGAIIPMDMMDLYDEDL
ncbi:hypothetical protein GGS23DRAFT_125116 [Durotheca rogersii]|uniref:uncharacterized protein n=1 Tax=Durotheca rogersii TaxID=419775 RepID=UPI00221EB8B2|nr:uncharacterized protein GGS23DRAFT_125116 [Durotheca rogersii]KAI5862045.1 hypothetical protein GGS23DRAFT_125116 [Durotheca rogersii]